MAWKAEREPATGREEIRAAAGKHSDAILLSNAMKSPIESNLEEIARLCRLYAVRRLAVFGSILRPDFEPGSSDADFLVEFEPLPAGERILNYLRLQEALGSLLSRQIDLVEDGSIRNPYILQRVKEQQQLLYAA